MMTMDRITMIAPKSLQGLPPFCQGGPTHLLMIEKKQVPIGPSQCKQETGKKQMRKINTKVRLLVESQARPKSLENQRQDRSNNKLQLWWARQWQRADWTAVGVGEHKGQAGKSKSKPKWEGPTQVTYCSHSLPHVHFYIFPKSSRIPPFFPNPSPPSLPPTGPVTPSCGCALNWTTGGFSPNQTQDTGTRGNRRADGPIIITDEQFIFKHRMPVEPTVKQRFFQSYCDIISVGLMYEYSPIIPYLKPISKLVCYSRTMCRTTTIFIVIAYYQNY